jgi:hypothetical protein
MRYRANILGGKKMSEQSGTNRPAWEAEQDHPELAAKLKEGLSEVIDPNLV